MASPDYIEHTDAESSNEDSSSGPNALHRIRKSLALGWIKTPLGWLKIGELICAVMSLIIMSAADVNFTSKDIASVDFFFFVQSACLIMVGFTIMLYMANLLHRLPDILRSNAGWAIVNGLGFVINMISSSVLIPRFLNRADVILAASSFGLISMFLFFFEGLFFVLKMKRDGSFSTSGTAVLDLD